MTKEDLVDHLSALHLDSIEAAQLLRDEFKIETPWRLIFIGGVFENCIRKCPLQSVNRWITHAEDFTGDKAEREKEIICTSALIRAIRV